MFMTSLARHAQQALDLDALELLPEPERGATAARCARSPPTRAATRPAPSSCGTRAGTSTRSRDDGRLGVYVRIGLYPNLGVCLVHGVRLRPGRAGGRAGRLRGAAAGGRRRRSRVVDRRARRRARCEQPLRALPRDARRAPARRHDDRCGPAARRARASRCDVALDLTWETDGEPYAYRLTTRYEIPCRVSGTVRIGGEELRARAAPASATTPGAPRDWWSMDWMWSAAAPGRRHAPPRRRARLPDAGLRRRLRAARRASSTRARRRERDRADRRTTA